MKRFFLFVAITLFATPAFADGTRLQMSYSVHGTRERLDCRVEGESRYTECMDYDSDLGVCYRNGYSLFARLFCSTGITMTISSGPSEIYASDKFPSCEDEQAESTEVAISNHSGYDHISALRGRVCRLNSNH